MDTAAFSLRQRHQNLRRQLPNQIILITLQAESVLQLFLILSGNQQFRHFVKWWIKHAFAILYNHQIINIDNIRLMYLHETG